jgi:hypothetical protein
MLPDGLKLMNPFLEYRGEPSDGAASLPGQTGYVPVSDGMGRIVGCVVTGYGSRGNIVVLSNLASTCP